MAESRLKQRVREPFAPPSAIAGVTQMRKVNQVTLDRSGRVVIPKGIRAQLGLRPGARLIVEAHEDGEIRLRLVGGGPRLVNKGGVLVVQAPATGELAGVETEEREARLGDLLRRAGL